MKKDPNAQGGDWLYAIALLIIALLPRLFVALAWSHEPVWDGHYYHFGATRIAEGLGYSEDVSVNGALVWKPWTHYPVGYSAWLSVFYRVFGSSVLTAPLVNAFSGALLCFALFRLARYGLSQNRARVAGALVALHPGLIAYSALVMTETTAALFLVLAAWSALALRRTTLNLLLTGACLAAAIYIRPASAIALAGLFLLLGRPFLHSLFRCLGVLAIATLLILPWTYRNCKVMDGCAVVSTNGGWNLAIGALTETGRFRSLHAADGCPIVTGQVQQDRCWSKVGAQAIAADPQAWLAKMPLKLSQTFDHESFAINYLGEAAPSEWSESRKQAGRDLLTIFHWLLLSAAALSPVALVTRGRVRTITQGVLFFGVLALAAHCLADPYHPFFMLVVLTPFLALLPFPGRPHQGPVGRYALFLVFGTALTHAVFFGDDRYHLVLSPLFCLLAAAALRKKSLYAAEKA